MLSEVKQRLEDQVPELTGRVGRALDFQKVLASGRAPSGGVNVWVLPGTTQGQPVEVIGAGLFVQPVRRGVSVVTMIQSAEDTGARALDRIDDFIMDITRAIAGWTHDDTTTGVFELVQERPLQAPKGLMAFMTEFRINDQLRIPT